jgi:hypothetical protein
VRLSARRSFGEAGEAGEERGRVSYESAVRTRT